VEVGGHLRAGGAWRRPSWCARAGLLGAQLLVGRPANSEGSATDRDPNGGDRGPAGATRTDGEQSSRLSARWPSGGGLPAGREGAPLARSPVVNKGGAVSIPVSRLLSIWPRAHRGAQEDGQRQGSALGQREPLDEPFPSNLATSSPVSPISTELQTRLPPPS